MPIAHASLTLSAGGTSTSASSGEDGRFSLALPPGPGPYSLRATRIGYLPLTVVIAAEDAAGGAVWRDLRLSPDAVTLPGLVAQRERRSRDEVSRRPPGSNNDVRVSWLGEEVPMQPGDLSALAALQSGVQDTDGGVSFFGLDPSQTRTTLDGATFGSTSLPQEALASTSIVGNAYDVARGQFSAGLVAATTHSGSNLAGGAVRTRLSHPRVQWGPSGGLRTEPESSFGYLDAGAGGGLVPNRLFWYAALSASERRTRLISLESASPPLLEASGVEPDSAARALDLMGGAWGRSTASRSANGLLRLDYDLSSAHSLMVRLDARETRADGVGASPLASRSWTSRLRLDGSGALVQLSSRFSGLDHTLRASFARERRRLRPERDLPSALVRVAGGDGSGSALLHMGGSPFAFGSEARVLEVASDALAPAGAHEIRFGASLALQEARQVAAGNRRGTFVFHGLDDLAAGRPALFTRTLGETEGEVRTGYGALYLGDVWRGRRFGVAAGMRVEGRWYSTPGLSLAGADFEPGQGRLPSDWGISPRIGWTYDGRGWYLRGGVGEFRGVLGAPSLARPLSGTGSAGLLTLSCVGAAAPVPEWDRYGEDPASVPGECEGGAGNLAASTPSLVYVPASFRAPRNWRASLGGVFPLLDRLTVTVDALLLQGRSQSLALDRNVQPGARFHLDAEGGRPVYAPASAIDPGTGGVAEAASRPQAGWGAWSELRSDGRSSSAQFRVDVRFGKPGEARARRPTLWGSYALTHTRDQVGGLGALEGSVPLAVDPRGRSEGPSDRERRHDVQLRLGYAPASWFTLGVLARLTSGAPFTPRVDGDVNGDGTLNDPAFAFDLRTLPDTALARGLERVLADVPEGVRDCLEAQTGSVVRRNSCRAGWTSALDLRADFQFWRSGVSRRMRVTVSTTHALSLVDRLVNGREGMRGWGEAAQVDPVLLRVRGFDPDRRAFRYEVNPGFGTRSGAWAGARRPFGVVLEGRIAVGRDPAYQSLARLVNRTIPAGRSADEIRFELARRLPNLPAQVLSLDAEVGLGLSPEQRAALIANAEHVGGRLAPLADSLAAALSAAEQRREGAREAHRDVERRLRELRAELDAGVRRVREILTSEQWDALPEGIRQPFRQLLPERALPGPVVVGE